MPQPPDTDHGTGPEWVAFKEAATRAGVSVSVLRKWVRMGKLDSQLTSGTHGKLRLVRMDQVTHHASKIRPAPSQQPMQAPAELVELAQTLPDLVEKLRDATDRAARAEVRSEFLSQQVAELKAQLEDKPDPGRVSDSVLNQPEPAGVSPAKQQPRRRWWTRPSK